MASHPYKTAPDRAFWSRSVSKGWKPEAALSSDRILLRKQEQVASAGSCFAANIIPYIEAAGFTYIRTERPHPLFADVPDDNFGYGKFSAAYGNIYTVRQMLQLIRRATGQFRPAEDRWHGEGAVIDPYRPGLRYPAKSDREFDVLTAQHLGQTRRAFEQADVFVFTLGLTEAWVSTFDGAVFPACPGTVAGSFDPQRHAFHNFTVGEIIADLEAMIREIRAINSRMRIILTVSPVPLVATATTNHVVVASIYSKSVLRAAVEDVVLRHAEVSYFPAYEIITGPQAPEEFFEPDRRNVSQKGIAAVMNALLAHCEAGVASISPAAEARAPRAASSLSKAIVDYECEEAMLDERI